MFLTFAEAVLWLKTLMFLFLDLFLFVCSDKVDEVEGLAIT